MIFLLGLVIGHLTIEPGFVPRLNTVSEAAKVRSPFRRSVRSAPFLTLSKHSADDPIDDMMGEAATVMLTYMRAVPGATMWVDWQRTDELGLYTLGTANITEVAVISGLGMVTRCEINLNASITDPDTFLFVGIHELIHCFGHGAWSLWSANTTHYLGPAGVSAFTREFSGSLRVNLSHWDCDSMNFTTATGFAPHDLVMCSQLRTNTKFLPAFSLHALAEAPTAFETIACVDDSDCAPPEVCTLRSTTFPRLCTTAVVVAWALDTPGDAHIEPGQTVQWVFNGTHNIQSGTRGNPTTQFSSGNRDDHWSHTFTEAGTFPYHCTLHPSMNGVITVGAPPTSSATQHFNPVAATVAIVAAILLV